MSGDEMYRDRGPAEDSTSKAALFDVGDTLAHWSVHRSDRFVWVCEQAGVTVPANAPLRRAAAVATERFFYGNLKRPDSWTSTWWTEQIAIGLAELGLPVELAPSIVSHRAALPNTWWIDPDAIPVLVRLRQRGYRIGLVSNWNGTLATLCADWGIAQLVDYIGDSTVFGERKPSASFFRHVLDQLGVPPERAFHVGDTYDDDVEGARGVGITPILIDPLDCEERECTIRIAKLRDVLRIAQALSSPLSSD